MGQKEKEFHGNFRDEQKSYDLIKIIILNLGNLGKKGTSHRLLNLLNLIFMDKKKTSEKEKILHDEYKIKLTRDMREELVGMGGLMEPLLEIVVAEKALADTEKMGLEYIRNLMKTLKLTAQEAMDASQVPKDKQKEYLQLMI